MGMDEQSSNQITDGRPLSNNLPDDNVIGILSRVPVKPLGIFKSVSRPWLRLISSRVFANTHLSEYADNKDYTHHRLLLTQSRSDLFSECGYGYKCCPLPSLLNSTSNYYVSADERGFDYRNIDTHQSSNVSFVGSVNGLICLYKYNGLLIWNPSIKKIKKIFNSCRFQFMRSHQWRIYSFGYDEKHDDYKVVCIFCCPSSDVVAVDLYSLNTDSWTSVLDCPSVGLLRDSGKFVKGNLHWAANVSQGDRWTILSFDLTKELWGNVEKPPYEAGNKTPSVGVLENNLCVFSYAMGSHTDVWVMKEYGFQSSWTKMYSINYPRFSPFLCPTLCRSNKGELLIVSGATIMIHNPDEDSIRYLKGPILDDSNKSVIYVESLVSPLL